MKIIVTNKRQIPVGANFTLASDEEIARIDDVTEARIGPGDLIAKVTSAIGIQPCIPCEERGRKLNEWWFGLADKFAEIFKNG